MNMLKKIAICMLSLMLFACPNCPGGHPFITVLNDSDQDIECQVNWGSMITSPEDSLFVCDALSIPIEPGSLFNFDSLNEQGWECDFTVIPYVQIFIVDNENYSKYQYEPCDTIRKYVPVLHRYQLTLEDLIRMNWTVVYPPK